MKKEKKTCPYQILIAIINNQKVLEASLLKTLEKYSVEKAFVSRASGTAESSISDFFGFGITEKDIFSCFVPAEIADNIIEDVEANMKKSKHNKGIVFTLPLTAIDSRIFESLEGNYEQRN